MLNNSESLQESSWSKAEERRKCARVRQSRPVEATCKIENPKASISCFLTDISMRGIYIKYTEENEGQSVRIGSTAVIIIEIGNTTNALACYVVRISNDGLGLQFTQSTNTDAIGELYSQIDHSQKSNEPNIRIELQSVSRSWGKHTALHNVSTTFDSGEVVALVGPSGGGKSTLLRLIAGVLKSSTGKVVVNRQNLDQLALRELRLHRACCGIIHQQHMLVPQVTVHQNVIAGMLGKWSAYKVIYSSLWPIEKKRVATLLTKLGIASTQWQLASTLSGGQQQRVAIARAIISSPKIILADEPTASLDPATAKEATQLIVDHAKREKALLIFCTHHLDIVRKHCDRIIGLSTGQCVFDMPASNITEHDMESLYAGSRERI